MVTAEVLADDQEYNDVSGVGLSCLLCCACCAVPAVLTDNQEYNE
jgi:hypothetical protein